MSDTAAVEEFAQTYIDAWSTTDDAVRRQLVDQLYAEDADFFADEPGDEAVQRRGRAEIFANITGVNERLTQGAGLAPRGTAAVANHDLLRVSWEMTTAEGELAMTGMNLLTRDGAGMIIRDYIFIG